MKPSHAANLALVLVVVGWTLIAGASFAALGDPAPTMPHSGVVARRYVIPVIWSAGTLVLIGALWLSGYAFSLSRWRSSIALLAAVLPLVVILAYAF